MSDYENVCYDTLVILCILYSRHDTEALSVNSWWPVTRCRGSCQISSFLKIHQQKFQRELDNLKLVEDTLDTLIKSCAQQLFDMTDDEQNAEYPFTRTGSGERASFGIHFHLCRRISSCRRPRRKRTLGQQVHVHLQ